MNGCVWLLCAGRAPSGAIVQINVSQMTRSKRENKSFVTAIKKKQRLGIFTNEPFENLQRSHRLNVAHSGIF